MRPNAFVCAIAVIAAGCARNSSQSPAALGPIVPMQIAGAASSGASIAASLSRVVMVWAATNDAQTNIYAAVSSDGGRTFAAPIRVNDIDGDARVNDEQPPRVAADLDIVVAWQSRRNGTPAIRFARSTNGGRSFEPAQTAHDASLTGTRGWSSVALDGDNAVHVAWLDTRPPVPVKETAAKTTAATPHVHGSGSTKQNIFHAVVKPDGTRTESLVAEDVCFCCKTGVAVDAEGTTYVAWRHVYPTNLRDMAVARSPLGGSFAPPVRVSEDGWELTSCPEDGPAIVVDGYKVVHIAWPTLVDAAKSRKGIFYSYSTDGGRTFAPRIRVDQASEQDLLAAHPQISTADDGVAVVWDEGASGNRHIQLRSITSSGQGPQWRPELGPPVTVSDAGPVSHPNAAETFDDLIVTWTQDNATGSDVRVRRVPFRALSLTLPRAARR